jgi:hypothetical protein
MRGHVCCSWSSSCVWQKDAHWQAPPAVLHCSSLSCHRAEYTLKNKIQTVTDQEPPLASSTGSGAAVGPGGPGMGRGGPRPGTRFGGPPPGAPAPLDPELPPEVAAVLAKVGRARR